jgi:alpha-beta hydrolase superfamily lysophospholipase
VLRAPASGERQANEASITAFKKKPPELWPLLLYGGALTAHCSAFVAWVRWRRKVGRAVGAALPKVLILHGTADKSVPMEIAIEFVAALKASCGSASWQ